MAHIMLHPDVSDDVDALDFFRAEIAKGVATTEDYRKEAEKLINSMQRDDAKWVTCAFARDDDGNEYNDVRFTIEAHWTRNGDLYVAGGGFALNAHDIVRRLNKMMDVLDAE